MNLQILAISKGIPGWVKAGYDEYAKRLSGEFKLKLVEITPEKRSSNINTETIITREGERLLAAIPSGSHIIALDERGTEWSTLQLAQEMNSWRSNWQNVALLVGGADGLAPMCRTKANAVWALSKLTLPHHMVKVILAEQLYRASTILAGHPYHRQ